MTPRVPAFSRREDFFYFGEKNTFIFPVLLDLYERDMVKWHKHVSAHKNYALQRKKL